MLVKRADQPTSITVPCMLHGVCAPKLLHSIQSQSPSYLLLQFEHHVWHLDILFRLIFGRHFKNHIFLVIRDRFLADCLYKLAQPAHIF